ncbi:MAG: pilus assembly protein [Kiloniellales bacterium]|nr:pilus assembly protein [Kiloniellales bacterium]
MVEMAIAFPVFILMLVGVVELSMLMFVQIAVEGGLREASRFGITGQTPGGEVTREQKIAEIVVDHAQSLVEIEPSDIELLVYNDFSSVGQPEPYIDADPKDGADFKEGKDEFVPEMHDKNGNGTWDEDQGDSGQGAGASGAIVLYRVNFDWPWMTPFFAAAASSEKVTLEAAITVRNEPWPDEG